MCNEFFIVIIPPVLMIWLLQQAAIPQRQVPHKVTSSSFLQNVQ